MLLHRIVRANLASFLAEAAQCYPSGELPDFIRCEFERYLRCGLLCHGFTRVRCPTCRDELLVAFSCKNRGVCPPCSARPMSYPGARRSFFPGFRGNDSVPRADPTHSRRSEKFFRTIVPRLLHRLAEEPEFPADPEGMQLLAQALQTGAARPVDDPPQGLCIWVDGFSSSSHAPAKHLRESGQDGAFPLRHHRSVSVTEFGSPG